MHQTSGITTVVQNHVGAFFWRTFGTVELEDAVGKVPVIGQGLALKGEHGRATLDQCRSGLVLR